MSWPQQQSLLDDLKEDSRRELQAALAIAAILPLLGVAFWALFRRCVLKPLGDLGSQMVLLARKDFRTVDLVRIDASLHPLFQKYNRLVGRMQDLEEAHVKRESVLREELQRTTRALVEQQIVLARADKLAVLGDLAARMAHRLRSPLSAVLMTLTNLREETGSPEQKERLGQSIEAVKRGLQELTALLEEAKQEPEAATRVDLRRLVDDLFLLLCHQTQGRKIELHNAVPPGLFCRLPEAATRHALMNLLLNAVDADQWPPGRRVCVGAGRVGEGVRIRVEDNRTGFSETELRVGFPGTSPWSRRGGPLGLAIVRRFVDHLGGTLVLENPSCGGARATLTIPQVETDG
jgi:two-component system, NtrC family, sensor kinase